MILLRALKAIPNAVCMIDPGQVFYEPDPDQEAIWIKQKYAEPVLKINGHESPALNSRGWDGLFWDGASVCIMASGPSMNPEQANAVWSWRKASDAHRVIVINTTFKLAPWADVLYACDGRWWTHYLPEVTAIFTGEKWTQDKVEGVKKIESQRGSGLSRKPGVINQGSASGYQAINLAYLAGAKKLILLGYDCKPGKKAHWHPDHPSPLNANNPYGLWLQNFKQLAADLKAEGVEVVNATPGSAIADFPMGKWQEALA